MHLAERLPARSHAAAAFGGLQDSAPRAALFGLHARMADVDPMAWADPALVQIWFRGADYVVPRRDVGMFTIGASPRDDERRAGLDALADKVLAVLDGNPMRSRDLVAAVPELNTPGAGRLRALCVTGKLHIRWDARTVDVLPAPPLAGDEEESRRELARRFLHWLGPANALQFAKWAGVDPADARTTWNAITSECVDVATPRGTGMVMLAADEDALRTTTPVTGVRLLNLGDPFLYPHGGLVVASAPAGLAQRARDLGATSRVVNSLGCRVVLDGELIGSWGRAGRSFTVIPWRALTRDERDLVDAEIAATALPLGAAPRVTWLDD